MATSSGSQSSGQSSSSSVPGLINSPASDWELQLAQMLQQVGNGQMQWALQQYARTGQITDAQINNYIQTAQQGTNLAGNLTGRYENLYAPQEDQYANEAGSYASAPRIQNAMGRAESGVMQAGNRAKTNAEQELQSFGIDPSSGRYQDLVRASNTANAASAAGAGEQARLATEAEGTRRREAAIAMGQQLPGAAVNSLNSAYQGIAGAENAALGLANTGVNLTTSASKYYDPAMNLKYPPVGQNSQSQSRQGSTSGSVGGGGGSGGGSSDPFGIMNYGLPSGGGGEISSSRGNVPAYQSSGSARSTVENPYYSGDNSFDPSMDPNAGVPSDASQNSYDPNSSGFGDTGGASDTNASWSEQPSYDPTDAGWGDTSGASDQSQSFDYAQGGVIPSSMSPSSGQQTDDVPAQIQQNGGKAMLNAGEFVLPRDVVAWKGQEFFQKMIAQARKARLGAPAKPSAGTSNGRP